MSANTTIAWTDRTWNPVRGCSLVSEGCRNCYAMKQAHRFSGKGKAYEGLTRRGPSGPVWTGDIRVVETALDEPRYWHAPSRIFVNSMSDLFHEGVPPEFVLRVFDVIEHCPQHVFQILTKRPERMLDWFAGASGAGLMAPALENVWLGVSVENRDTLHRIDTLKDVPAVVRFVSFEPLLEDVGAVLLDRIHWIIIGGESGYRAREFDVLWAESLLKQAEEQRVAAFVKQLGSRPFIGTQPLAGGMTLGARGLTLRDPKGADPSEWNWKLRVQNFPQVSA